MKKSIVALAIAFGAVGVKADVITNYVYVVSNIFNNVYSESIITQKVKSTHTDYYFTNYVSIVTNVYQTTFQTNIEVDVIFDNFEPWVIAASNYAANASSYADDSAASASSASSSASSANSAANRAAASASSASSYASDGLSRINARIAWFDEHSGETITNVNISTNLYFAEDSVARLGVTNNALAIATNADAIAALDSRVSTLELDAYATDPAFGGVYVFVFTLNSVSWRFTVTIDTNSHGQEKTDSGIKYTVYYNSVSGSTNPCTVSGTRPSYLIIRKVLTGSNAGKLEVRYSTNGNTWSAIRTSDVETSPVVLPTSFGTNYGYLESYTNAKKPVYQWAKDKFDELWLFVTNAQNTVTSE